MSEFSKYGLVAALVLSVLAMPGVAFAQTNSANVSVSQTSDGNPVAGSNITVSVTVQADAGANILALSLSQTLPTGATFLGIASSSGAQPPIAPESGDGGTLEFAWIVVPDLPYLLTYNVALGGNFVTPSDVVGQVEYRTTGAAEFSNAAVLTLQEEAVKQGLSCACAPGETNVAAAWTDWLIVAMVLLALIAARLAQPLLSAQRVSTRQRN